MIKYLRGFKDLHKLKVNFFLAAILVTSAIVRIASNSNFEAEFHTHGDATFRTKVAFDLFEYGFNWGMSGFFMPLYFYLYQPILHIHQSIKSLIIFQIILSLIGLASFYTATKFRFSEKVALLSTFLLSINYFHIILSVTLMSELVFFLFVCLCLVFAYRFEVKPNFYNYFLTTLFAGLSGLVRYEGMVVFFAVWIVMSFKYRRTVPIFLSLLVYFIPSALYEYNMFQETGILLYGLASNPEESRQVNLALFGISSLTDRILGIFRVTSENGGFFVLPGVLALFHLTLKKKFNITYLVTGICTGMVYISALKGDIAFFERYFLTPIALLTPYGVSLIWKFINTSKKFYIKVPCWIALITLASISSYKSLTPQIRHNPKSFGAKEIVSDFIRWEKPTHKTKIFFDDYSTAYTFYAFYIYFRELGIRQECCALSNQEYLNYNFEFEKIEPNFLKLVKDNKFEYYFVFRFSPLNEYLEKNNFMVASQKLSLVRSYEFIRLFRVE